MLNATIGSFNGTLLSLSKRLDSSGLTCAIQESPDFGVADDWTEVTGINYTKNVGTISDLLNPRHHGDELPPPPDGGLIPPGDTPGPGGSHRSPGTKIRKNPKHTILQVPRTPPCHHFGDYPKLGHI